MKKVSESCSQPLQGLKPLVNQVVHSATDNQRLKGALSSHTRKNPRRQAPCAHLTIKKPIKNSPGLKTSFPGLKGKLITSWEEKVGVAHMRQMSYSQGSLRIKHQGLYYIYAQILFRYHADHPMSTREYQLIQYVYKKMAKYPTPTLILRGASTWCSVMLSITNKQNCVGKPVFQEHSAKCKFRMSPRGELEHMKINVYFSRVLCPYQYY
ncbi:tumor necrosis factor ligand superfamily member 11 [Heptranchias perlo]|uniref:tumor necrosis factor ligand superfamily member 11 n=1 Tax=Heptranchias perlo TaxID=212740 RepID=UPI00355A7040